MRVIFLMLLLTGLSCNVIQAQQLPLFSQYLFNGLLINPAFAGLDGLSTVNVLSREQWLGIPNSPKTQVVSFQTRILGESFIHKSASARQRLISTYTSGRVGVGGYVFNDQTGLISRSGAEICYAYHLKMDEATLSLGLNADLTEFYIDKNNLVLPSTSSSSLANTSTLNLFYPDMGFGAVYTAKDWYAGLSIDQLFQAYLHFGNSSLEQYRVASQINVMGSYHYDLDDQTQLEPNLLFKVTTQGNFQADISAKVHFISDYWAGLSYRTESGTGGAIVFICGAVVDPFTFGLSYDYNLSPLQYTNIGSFEISAAYKFGNTPSRLRWLNR